jgi:hypothetical protein
MNEFRNNNNLSTLWDVLIEENIISIQNEKKLKSIQQIFEICINKFCKENEELFKKSSLLNINKLFIKYFKVEQQFQIKQQEFQSFHTINIPTEPELQNTILDKPISNMNLLVEEMIKKRNLDYIPAPIVPIVPENNIKKLKIEDILEDYDNKSINLDKKVGWTDEKSKVTKEFLNNMLEKDKITTIKNKLIDLLKDIEELDIIFS